MIYLNPLARESIFSKLFQALNPGGILVLGAVEIVPSVYAEKLIRKSNYGKIYQKL